MNVCSAVNVFALARLRPIVLAVLPLYVPENVRVPSVAVRLPRLEPSAIPEIVELANIALVIAPVPIVRAPPDSDRPEPSRLLNDEPFTIRFVVEAVANDEYVVEELTRVVKPVTFSVDVAVIAPPTNRELEMYPDPATSSLNVGDVVEIPKLPAAEIVALIPPGVPNCKAEPVEPAEINVA